MLIDCEQCKQTFKGRKGAKYCSQRCYGDSKIGIKHFEETKQKIAETHMAEKNPMWKGDKVGKLALHEWVAKRIPKPKFCECCGSREPMDLANKSGQYLRDLSDWNWLCRQCHMILDGRMANLTARWSKS